jgi:hypothetical protein
MRFVLVTIASLLTSVPAFAAGPHCNLFQTQTGALKRPSPPSCMDSPFAVTNETSFDACRMDVKVYLNHVDDYLKCLNEEGNDTVRESNQTVDRFNCKISGAICS